MPRTMRKIALSIACFVLLVFTVILVNQTEQLVNFATRFDPLLGRVLLWTLVGGYAVSLAVPLYLWLRMPAPLVPPASDDSPEFKRHLVLLGERLSRNRRLRGLPTCDRSGIEAAICCLDQEANEVVRRTAATVFLSTAVSQSGRLDLLMVLATQVRMVWQVAHIYQQRPAAREMLALYANVAGTAFVAGELDDIEVEPLVAPLLGATLGSIPGLQQVTAVMVKSAISGAANAFLTLRVGMIVKRYSNALVLPDRRLLRKSASAEAAALLGTIVTDGVRRISKGAWAASTARMKRALRAGA